MDKNEVLEFYKQTSCYTDLGLYKDFAKNLSNSIEELCLLQRHQIIHPATFRDENIRNNSNCFWGDMTKIPITKLNTEEDLFPTAQSIIAELLRRNSKYNIKREAKDKVHITCRGQAILLASILKSKEIPARVRSGFTYFSQNDDVYHDHWITEYFNEKENRWIFVDADMCCNNLNFNPYDIPKDCFLTAAQSYLNIRNNIFKPYEIYSAEFDYNSREKYYIKTIVKSLMYDFHCLMNDEIIYLHYPKYFKEKNFILDEFDYQELDHLANLMLNPDDNFKELKEIWENNLKFRIMTGGLN